MSPADPHIESPNVTLPPPAQSALNQVTFTELAN